MKGFVASSFTILCISLLSSCGSNVNLASSLDTAVESRPDKVLFSVDLRPVDGALTEIILEKNADGKYDASKHVVIVSRSTGISGEKRETLATGLACKFSSASISCVVDRRPVDGALQELEIVKRSDAKFDASLRTVYVSRRDAATIDETKIIAEGLKLARAAAESTVEIDSSDADKLFAALESLGVEDTARLIGATNLGVKDLRCDTDVSNPSRKIRCNYRAINANSGALESFTGVEGKASDDLFAVLNKNGLAVNAGINPNYRAVAVKSLTCSLPVVPNPVAHCTAERL